MTGDKKITHIKPCANVAQGLRNIADDIEQGLYEIDDITLCGSGHVFHLGQVDDRRAAANAVFNMNYGIHKLMSAAVNSELE